MDLFLFFLALTLALEAPFFWCLLGHRRPRERVALWLAANFVSYPAVFFVFPYLPASPAVCEMTAEIWAPLVEAGVGWFVLPNFGRRDFTTIIGANLCSWLIGKALMRVGLAYFWAL